MDCAKQGLKNLVARNYKGNNDYSEDFSGLPRPNNNLVFLLEGTVDIISEGIETHFVAGDVFFIANGVRYVSRWHSAPAVDFITVHFNFETETNPFRQKLIPVQKIEVADSEYVKSLFLKVLKTQDDNSFAFNAVFYELCAITVALLKYTPVTKVSAVQPAIDYIDSRPGRRVAVKELAALCCLSESRFYCVFKDETGLSPIEYKNILCIRHAMRALADEPDKSVEAVAADFGFDSAVYFRRLFKSVTGLTPTDYRKKCLSASL